jgi:hypothetical protein
MANPLFGMLGGQNPMQMLMQLKQNPLSLLQKVGFNIPTNLSSPQQIVEHLTKTGQINQAQLNQAQQMAQMFNVNMR